MDNLPSRLKNPLSYDVVFREPQNGVDLDALHETPQQSVARSRDMSLHIFLRNMTGASPGLGESIRSLAEDAASNFRIMRVLETGNGVPFKTLNFQENSIRELGDFMIYGEESGPHPAPRVVSTVIAAQDYVEKVLTDQIQMDPYTQLDIIGEHLDRMMGYPAGFRQYDSRAKAEIMDKYKKKKGAGEIVLHLDENPVTALRRALSAGERFDLAFPDLLDTTDRMNLLQVVQASLTDGDMHLSL